jgi:hypothetical protein
MSEQIRPRFFGGSNIALKVPPHQFDSTVLFYRDVIGLKPLDELAPAVVFEFGANRLWIDRVPSLSQAEVWLELQTPDPARAVEYLKAQGVTRCDEIEPLPDDFRGFWISSPACIIHLVASDE